MRKNEQMAINTEVEKAFEAFKNEGIKKSLGRLRSCTASVFETENYYVLQSYSTIIAIIDKRTDTLYDGLRLVYGYTSTSAQHIAKFRKDYGGGGFSGISHK